jgi:hypothetical protein
MRAHHSKLVANFQNPCTIYHIIIDWLDETIGSSVFIGGTSHDLRLDKYLSLACFYFEKQY